MFPQAARLGTALLVAGLSGCNATSLQSFSRPTNVTQNTTINNEIVFKLDAFRLRYPELNPAARASRSEKQLANDAELAKKFEAVRADPGWSIFVQALALGDAAVNQLMDESVLDASKVPSRIAAVNAARTAWRRASTFGIRPPELPVGFAAFEDSGLSFEVHVRNERFAFLVARTARGQILGIFDLELSDRGRTSVVTHLLERPMRMPELYLNTPWDEVLVSDDLRIRDIELDLDRILGKATVREEGREAIPLK